MAQAMGQKVGDLVAEDGLGQVGQAVQGVVARV